MTPALDALTERLFDYAGMFPPAALSFEEAVQTSLRFSRELRRPGLVGSDLVLQLPFLPKLTDEAVERSGAELGEGVRVCVLGAPLESGKAEEERRALAEFNERRGSKSRSASVVAYEVKVSTKELGRVEELGELFGKEPFLVAVEPDPFEEDALAPLTRLLQALGDKHPARFVLKVRGTTLDARMMARILEAAVAEGVGLKATQNLHHPILEESRYGNKLGFLNLVVAWVLTTQAPLAYDQLLRCLSTSKPRDFSFEGDLFRWEDRSLTVEEIRALRAKAFLGIGSCSIHEPDEDLERLFGA
jgi:hypothetical protein